LRQKVASYFLAQKSLCLKSGWGQADQETLKQQKAPAE
jgi:hypothetical protein